MQESNLKLRLFDTYSSMELYMILDTINKNILTIHEYLGLDIFPVTKIISEYTYLIETIQITSSDHTNHFNKIVYHLQIHDLLMQKLDHIYTFHQGLMKDLTEIISVDQIRETNYLSVLHEILSLNKIILYGMKDDYFLAIESIKAEVYSLESYLKFISKSAPKTSRLFLYQPLFEKEMDAVCLLIEDLLERTRIPFMDSQQKEIKLKI